MSTSSSEVRALHVNHRYVLDWAASARPGARVLDFGCGPGLVVQAARLRGLQAFGADSFYDAVDDRPAALSLGEAIREIRGDRLDFEDGAFDLVFSNMVFEHVERLDPALAEIHRVLRKGGLFLCLFPAMETVREGHFGIPFIHWFRAGSGLRHACARFWRALGGGYHTEGKSPEAWTRDALAWIDRYTFYRGAGPFRRAFERHFRWMPMEEDCVRYRLSQGRLAFLAPLLRIPFISTAARMLYRRLAHYVVLGVKK